MQIWIPFLSAVVGAGITGVFGLIMWGIQRRKWDAETNRTEAETEKIHAETRDLTSVRLIRELDRIAAINAQLGTTVETQRAEIDALRGQILEYAKRELNHVAEEAALRMRINELEKLKGIQTTPLDISAMQLNRLFPPEIDHTPSEFDDSIDDS